MARQVVITILTADNSVYVVDANGSDRYAEYTTGLNSWWVQWFGDAQTRAGLQFVGDKVGAMVFGDISSASLDGVDQISAGVQAQDLQELFAVLGPHMFIRGASSGASTAANQTTLLTRIGPGDGSVAQSTNGLLLAVVTSVLEQEIFLPKSSAAPQLTTQGSDTGYIDVEGSKSGSFNWMFTLGAGTNGLGTLYGNNDGVDSDFDVEIANTASQTADAAGVISWTLPWKYIKFVFTTQTGAGSTFDGSIYAL